MASVTLLKSNGFDITAIGLEYAGISDEEVMHIAIQEDRTIITYDSDYGELIFKKGYKVIFIRNQPEEPLETAKVIQELTSNNSLSFNNTLTVVDSNSIRQKKY